VERSSKPVGTGAKRWTVCFVSITFAACSSTATIRRGNGPAYEAAIASSDEQAVYVRGENGMTYRVPRAEVVDIDHPGNIALTVGASLLAYGVLMGFLIHNEEPNPSSVGESVAVGALFAGPGAVLAGVGGLTYLHSRQRASAFENAVVAPIVAPPAQPYLPPGYGWPVPQWQPSPPPPPPPAPAAPPTPPPAPETAPPATP
jgi:hypothetical protein